MSSSRMLKIVPGVTPFGTVTMTDVLPNFGGSKETLRLDPAE